MTDKPADTTYAELDIRGRGVKILDSLGRLDLDNLKEEASVTGAESLWFGILAARAQTNARMAKVDFEILEAQLDREVREAFALKGVKTTEPMVEASVKLDPRWREAQQRMYDAEEAASICESAKFTLIRKDGKVEALAGLIVQEVSAYRGYPLARGAVTDERAQHPAAPAVAIMGKASAKPPNKRGR